jgi:hypothetical protein
MIMQEITQKYMLVASRKSVYGQCITTGLALMGHTGLEPY